jgi:hypothetical protein
MPYRVATADGLTGHTLFSLRVEINLGLKKGYTMSALQLQSAGLEYARNVREFQREISDANMSGIERQIGQVPGEDEAARSARWHRQNIEQMERHNRYQEKFRAEFRADGVLLYEELLRRTGETKHSHLVALEHGMLAGASPLEEVAQEIEKLSKKLSITPLN